MMLPPWVLRLLGSFAEWTGAMWMVYGALWAITKALDSIVFIAGTVLPPFPTAFRRALLEAIIERQQGRKVRHEQQ